MSRDSLKRFVLYGKERMMQKTRFVGKPHEGSGG